MRRQRNQFIVGLAFLATLCCGHSRSAAAQEGSKDIRSEEVIDRPNAAAGGAVGNSNAGGGRTKTTTTPTGKRRTATYRSLRPFSRTPVAPAMEYAQLGLTIWRLQKSDGSKDLEQEGQEAQLEQVESSTALSIGSTVRIGIEPLTHDGYLYVIDREQFADGTYGAARLIFPTLKTRNGNNSVRAHELVLIPRPPSYFRINPSTTGKTQTAEVLTTILSPTPLQLPAPLGDRAMTLSDALFKSWEKQWSAPVNVLEMNGGSGLTTSVKSQVDGSKDLDQEGEERQQLTQSDPLPQTIYRASIVRGKALLVTTPLRFRTGQ
jgi:hypothetical protein